MNARLLAAALLLAAAAASQGVAPQPVASQARGEAFVVTVHGGDEALARRALAVVEPVWPHVAALFRVEGAPPQLLPVHLYRTAAGYLAADQRLTGGRFGPNQAMTHWQSRSAHVAMQPPCSDAFLAEFGLPLQTEVMLLWEAVHVVRLHLCDNFQRHPGWFLDGLAATTAQQVFHELHPGLGPQPFFTQRWLRTKALLDEDRLPSLDELLRDDTGELDMRDRYAARVAWLEFVGNEADFDLGALVRAVRDADDAAAMRTAALAAFAGREVAFRERVRACAPQWNETQRSLWLLGDVWRQQAFADVNAVALRREPVDGGAFVARGTLWLMPGDKAQLNFLFAADQDGFYSLAMVAGVGCTLFEHRYDGNQWQRLDAFGTRQLRAGAETRFELRGEGTRLSVKLGDATADLTLPRPLPERIVWGVGAQSGGAGGADGTVGEWRGVTVTAPAR